MGQVSGSSIQEVKMSADTEKFDGPSGDVPFDGIHSMSEVLAEFWGTYRGRFAGVLGPSATEGSLDACRFGRFSNTRAVFGET